MLEELVQSAYNIFSHYNLPERITGCYCNLCLDENYNKYLHNKPLLSLQGLDLKPYISSVGVEEGKKEVKYFFPRILEIIYSDIENPDDSDFCIFIWGFLLLINYTMWKENEKLLMINFFKEYWEIVKLPSDIPLPDNSIDSIKETVFNSLALSPK